MTPLKRIENLEALAKALLQEASELKKVLAGDKPVRPYNDKFRDDIAKRMKRILK